MTTSSPSSSSVPENPQSSYWQLLNGVARDLDLMLQDLRPEYEGVSTGGQHGCTDDFDALEKSLTSALLLEQFVRGVGDDLETSAESPSGIYRSSPFSASTNGKEFDDSIVDELDGREAIVHSPSTPPSPAPPQFPPHSNSLQLQTGSITSSGGGGAVDGQSTQCSDLSASFAPSDETDGSSGTSNVPAPCDIGILERLIRTHHIWFLPGIGRAGAVHLLQGKEVGNFIVRQSSKQNTMALSVRLPEQLGPYIEHYLIETVGDGKLRLEGSDNHFDAIPMLVAHYCQCCDELPVALSLPRPLAQAAYRQELSSLALLGQDFWVSSLIQSPSGGSFSVQLPLKTDSIVTQPSSLPVPIPHSTFKPPPLPEAAKPSSQGVPPVTVVPASLENGTSVLPANVTPPPSSSPPVVVSSDAPKLPPRSIPPPPPPRTLPLATSRPSHGANILVTTTVSVNLSSNANNVEENESAEELESLDKLSSPVDQENSSHKPNCIARYTKQSGAAESPVLCYHSSLADKISDYEDIWASSPARLENNNRSDNAAFQPWNAKSHDQIHKRKEMQHRFPRLQPSSAKENAVSCKKELVSQETQTECCTEEFVQYDPDVPLKFITQVVSPALTADSGIGAHTDDGLMDNERTDHESLEKKWPEGQFSSPFYAEPVDSLAGLGSPVDGECLVKSPDHESSSFNQNSRCTNHRHSDPSLQWLCSDISQTDVVGMDDRSPSLFSSLDNFPQIACPQQPSSSIDVASQARIELPQNTLKKDSSTQVSCPDVSLVAKPQKTQGVAKKVRQRKKKGKREASWKVDSSWEWMGNSDTSEDDDDEEDEMIDDGGFSSLPAEWKFPVDYTKNHLGGSQHSDIITVEDLILQKSPHLRVPEIKPLTQSNLMRVSEYDNLTRRPPPIKKSELQHNDSVDDTATEFSEPWDSLRWDRLLRLVIPENEVAGSFTLSKSKDESVKKLVAGNNDKNKMKNAPLEPSESASMLSITSEVTSDDMNDSTSISDFQTISLDRERSKSFQERLEPYLTKQRIIALRNKEAKSVGENIRQYIFRLAQEGNNTFAKAIENFIQCTKDGNEINPAVVMRNIRQFMTGMKNYLLKHGEGHFDQLVQQERSKLRSDEFLNIDAIIEGALHKLVIKPLKNFLYQLFVNEYSKNGSLKLLSDSIRHAREKSPEEMGIRPEFQPPHGAAMEVVRHFLLRLQQAYSPLKKLENLLAAISTIYNSVQDDKRSHGKEHASLGADDFLPIFIYVLVHCGMISAEIEADYMWGLLHPSLLSGEGGYYLTTLSSAVHVLKSFNTPSTQEDSRNRTNSFHNTAETHIEASRSTGPTQQSPEPRLPSIADLQGFMKIMIPDEITGNIISKTLPVRPNMTTKEVCKMIAHKFKITNPQDYGLFKLTKGEETQLSDADCPQTIKADLVTSGVECMFAYKRCDARFVWPVLEKKETHS